MNDERVDYGSDDDGEDEGNFSQERNVKICMLSVKTNPPISNITKLRYYCHLENIFQNIVNKYLFQLDNKIFSGKKITFLIFA